MPDAVEDVHNCIFSYYGIFRSFNNPVADRACKRARQDFGRALQRYNHYCHNNPYTHNDL